MVLNLKAVIDFLVTYETLVEMLGLFVFGASLFYYVFITLLFEFICFAQSYNARYSKLESDLRVTNKLETLSTRMRYYVNLVVAYFLV